MRDIDTHSTTTQKHQNQSLKSLDAFDLVAQFHSVIHTKTITPKVMEQEVRMNALKIRPHAGDVFHVNMGNKLFIDVLWKVLKWEEYVDQGEKLLSKKEFEIFLRLMYAYREKLQEQINTVDIRLPHLKSKGVDVPVAIEIFRESKSHKTRRRKLH